ncbi:MAG: ABC transporter permease, partial [Mesorhizobium sp.]
FHNGQFVGPFVYGRQMTLDMDTLKRNYTDKQDDVQRIRFFCKGDSYRFWGLIEGDRHLVCPAENGQLFLAGTDRLGRDVLSRIIYGARISLTIGLVGIAFSFVLGIVIGGLAGYHGGIFDLIVQRIIEVLQSIPSIPLWLALAAIMPITWSPILIYFGITVILGLLHWTGLARAVRSKLLALREEDYVLAAQLMGASSSRIIRRHLIPGFMSHLIATATISIPGMILG